DEREVSGIAALHERVETRDRPAVKHDGTAVPAADGPRLSVRQGEPAAGRLLKNVGVESRWTHEKPEYQKRTGSPCRYRAFSPPLERVRTIRFGHRALDGAGPSHHA